MYIYMYVYAYIYIYVSFFYMYVYGTCLQVHTEARRVHWIPKQGSYRQL